MIDEDRKFRKIILTGSANVMLLPKVGDSLAGRIEIHQLWPLSQDEIEGVASIFLKTLTDNKKFQATRLDWKMLAGKMRVGGYLESLARSSTSRREKWFGDYLTAILQKDIRDLAKIEGLTEIPNVLKLIAARVGSTINMSDISRLSGIKNTT